MSISRARLLEVTISQGGRLFSRCLLVPGTYSIGQERVNAIVVDEPSVSGRHALLTVTEAEEIYLEDLGSSNGSFVDGAWAAEPTRITAESHAQVGACSIHVRRLAPFR